MTAATLERYRAWLEDSVSPVVRAWCPDAARRRYLEATAQYLERTINDEYSRRYARACPVAGVEHQLYRLRELSLSCGASLLAGIHFRGLATGFPFVGVFAQSRWLAEKELAEAHAQLMREFAVFAPRASWWWSPVDEHRPKLKAACTDSLLVMGSLAELRRQPAPLLPPEWQLRRCNSGSEVGAAFLELYRGFHRARPELAELVQAAPLDALEDCAKAGGLYACFSGSEVVAVVAAKPEAQYCVDAWLMWDIVLGRQYCGKGLAAPLQRAVLGRLDASLAPLVAGTINGENLPSLRTALRVGRQIVGAWTFIH